MHAIPPSGPPGEITCVAGESFVVSAVDGDLRHGDHGLYVRDTRFLDRLEVLVDGTPPVLLTGRAVGPHRARFHSFVPPEPGAGPDPTLLVTRHRLVDGSLHEDVIVANRGTAPRTITVAVRCGTDFAHIFDVKHRRARPAPTPPAAGDALTFARVVGVESGVVRTTPAGHVADDRIEVRLTVAPRDVARVCLTADVTDVHGTVTAPAECPDDAPDPIPEPRREQGIRFECADSRFTQLLRRSLDDLTTLQVADPLLPEDRFCAAGSPWYLTLFGRDALWAARMALPFDLPLAGGTLRTLARRQGRQHDPDTEEAPGKILHEIRRGSLAHRADLPATYYGSVDATPLFVVLAHEAWRWGLPTEEVRALLPAVEAALRWLVTDGDADGDGFVEYLRTSDRGLVNQGWKDSFDGVQFADGRIARPPITLVEVQGYAYDAARRGAELLTAFGRPGADRLHAFADRLREQFRRRFWVADDLGRFPAIALDGDDVPVDAPASNMGHLLLTGLLTPEEAADVARRLVHPSMASGWGLRTLATTAAGFNPVSYHCGSVWPHDTAIAAYGLAVSGHQEAASLLLSSLVEAAPHFGFRLPELFAGYPATEGFPVPYPGACRPQAWAAGAALLLLRACFGLDPAIPDGRLEVRPMQPFPFRHLEVRGLPLAGGTVDIRVDAEHGVAVDLHDAELEVVVR